MGYIVVDAGGKHVREVLETMPADWREWVKREPDMLSRFINVLPEIVKRLEGIETHLAEGARTPFVRSSHRLSTDLQDPNEILTSLNTRLESLEKVIGSKAK
jgi:hypothetical protein